MRTRFICDRVGCPTIECHPALDRWALESSRDPDTVARWWLDAPRSVLLCTGRSFDVLEVPAPIGTGTVADPAFDHCAGPVAVTPTGRWMFLVRPNEPLRPELDRRLDVLRHAHGSWIPAPPTVMREGRVRWVVPPERVDWRLAEPDRVQRLMVGVIIAQVAGRRAGAPPFRATPWPPYQPRHTHDSHHRTSRSLWGVVPE